MAIIILFAAALLALALTVIFGYRALGPGNTPFGRRPGESSTAGGDYGFA